MEDIVNRQIEMISVCAADGALTPIRFRMEDGEHMLRTVPIRQVVSSSSASCCPSCVLQRYWIASTPA